MKGISRITVQSEGSSDGKQQPSDTDSAFQNGINITNPSDSEHQSLDDEGLLQDDLHIVDQGDMPKPDGIVFKTLKRPEVSNMVKEGINDRFAEPIKWPEIGNIPEKELAPGYFGKVFPKLFPYGRADITCPSFGKKLPSVVGYNIC